jgi:rRNA maturation endonuclease Nob1
MTQEYLLKEKEQNDKSALTICENCKHLVPKTMLCLYCGEPILFKMPKTMKDK